MSPLLRASGCDSKTSVLKLPSNDGMIGGFSSKGAHTKFMDSETCHVVYYDNLLTFLDQDGVTYTLTPPPCFVLVKRTVVFPKINV